MIVAGCVAVVFGIVVDYFRRKGWVNKTQGWTVSLIIIALWNGGVYFLNKESIEGKIVIGIESAIKKMPLFQLIEEYEPQKYIRLKEKMIVVAKQHLSEQEMIDAIQPDMSIFQRERMQFSTDPWVVNIIRLNI